MMFGGGVGVGGAHAGKGPVSPSIFHKGLVLRLQLHKVDFKKEMEHLRFSVQIYEGRNGIQYMPSQRLLQDK